MSSIINVKVRKSLSIAVLIALFPLLPAQADLDDANMSNIESRTPSEKVYEAWCGVNQNDCKVKFRNGRMIVNNGSGITSNQVLELERRLACRAKIMDCSSDRFREENSQKNIYSNIYQSQERLKGTDYIRAYVNRSKIQRDLQKWIGKTITTSPN